MMFIFNTFLDSNMHKINLKEKINDFFHVY